MLVTDRPEGMWSSGGGSNGRPGSTSYRRSVLLHYRSWAEAQESTAPQGQVESLGRECREGNDKMTGRQSWITHFLCREGGKRWS